MAEEKQINKLYFGDCFDVFKCINEKVDLVFVDLPYGQTACKWDTKINLDDMWISLKEIIKPHARIVFTTTTKFGVDIINSNPSWFRYDLVWEKSNAVGFFNAKKQPLRAHEMIYIFGNPKYKTKLNKTSPIYNPQKTQGKPYTAGSSKYNGAYGKGDFYHKANITGARHPRSVIKFRTDKKRIHPTQKPQSLCEWIVKSYSNPGDTVLDFCAGSCSTAVACKNNDRNYICIEKNKEYYDMSVNRLSIIVS